MRKNRVYIGVIFLFVMLVIVVSCHIAFQNHKEEQRVKESKLPGAEKNAKESEGDIRVVLKTNGFREVCHSVVGLSSEAGLKISCGDTEEEAEPGQILTITPADERFRSGTIWVESRDETGKITISSLQRGYGTPSYRGKLELFQTAEGIVIVNELPLEEYLYAVVPSEMPSSYEPEALKAQAVCARSYAYNQTRDYAYPEYRAHVDDSTSFQVYGNSAEQESTICAVEETCGKKIWYGNQVATAYYYSTSCGKSAAITAWGREFDDSNRYLSSIDICNENGEAYEAALPWYRWTATVPQKTMSDLIELNTKTEIGTLVSLTVTKTGDGGIVQEITAAGTKGKVVVATENKIRSALGGSGYKIQKQDGTVVDSSALLPSAFFTIEKSGESYIIRGGGYGHGIGMSQNGANEMAKQGKTYREILTTFYTGVSVE